MDECTIILLYLRDEQKINKEKDLAEICNIYMKYTKQFNDITARIILFSKKSGSKIERFMRKYDIIIII